MLAFCFSRLNIHWCQCVFDQDGPLWSLVRALLLDFATLHLELMSEFLSRMEMGRQWRRSCSWAELVSGCASMPKGTWLCSVQPQLELAESCAWTPEGASSPAVAECRVRLHHLHRGPWKCSRFPISVKTRHKVWVRQLPRFDFSWLDMTWHDLRTKLTSA